MKGLRLSEGLSPTMNAIIANLRNGATRKAAAGAAGIHRATFYVWLKENPTFSDTVTRAEAEAEIACTAVIAKASAAGEWRASLEWLKRRRRLEWGDQSRACADREAERLLAELFPHSGS